MDQDSNQEPSKRLRSILSNHDDETNVQPQRQDQPPTKLQSLQLPHRKPYTPQASSRARETVDPQESRPAPARAQSTPLPAARFNAPQGPRQPPPEPPSVSIPQFAFDSRGLKFGPPFWTVTGILSLIVNGILIAVLLVLYNTLGQLQSLQGTASNVGASVLGGLYSNFEQMDRAAIKTVIPVDAQIPLNLTVPVKTTTQITLAQAVAIPNTYVEINTGNFTLNSAARVTLPAGTPLTINLNFDLPVQATVPVHLDVPVDIPMAETELHEPFVGLQEVVRPWYCLVEPNAFSLRGQAICR